MERGLWKKSRKKISVAIGRQGFGGKQVMWWWSMLSSVLAESPSQSSAKPPWLGFLFLIGFIWGGKTTGRADKR